MNTEALLTPISEHAPSGDDLSFSAEFDQIAELRREDDATLDQGEWKRALKTADWPAVQMRCADLLASRSKDLRLAMWLTEAAVMTNGYAGLRQGLDLCAQLSERFWPTLHPQPDGADMEQRIGNIAWLLGRVQALSTIAPVVKGRVAAYSLQQLLSARAMQAVVDRSPDAARPTAPEIVTLDAFKRALKDTPKAALLDTVQTVQACLVALGDWQAVVDGKLGAAGPSFVGAREALASALHEVQRLTKDTAAVSGDVPRPAAQEATPQVESAGALEATPGPIRSREQALAQLRDVARYFRSTEPHSPVTYLAEKAAHWGDMPLHVWLRAVVKDANALSQLEDLLGTAVPAEVSEPDAQR
jgi:type VI secretion system protein ImpA